MPPVEPDDDEQEDLGILCPNCAFANVPDADFCTRCAAPLSLLATIDPLKQTLTEGFAYRKAVDGTSKPIILVGIWLIFLPMAAALPVTVFNNRSRGLLELAWPTLIFLISVVVLYHTTTNFVRKRRELRDRPPEE